MKNKARELTEFPAMFIKKFQIKVVETKSSFFYQITIPFNFYISGFGLSIYRTLNGIRMQNLQMMVALEIVPQTGETRALITNFN